MKKQMACATLALALCLGLCPAFGAEEKFPAVNTYPGYADVAESDWFYANAKLCYEIGIMTGTDVGFDPNKALTQAEAVTLAARVGATLRGESIPAPQPGEPWWGSYYRYLFPPPTSGGPNYPEGNAARSQFLSILYNCVEPLLTPINSVKELPDPDLGNIVTVLKYYNAGILTGVDKYGTFAGEKPLTRAEAAAMVSRIVRPELRLSFTPADYSPFTAAYLTPGTVMFDNGVTAEEYLIAVNNAISAWEAALGDEFNWHYVWTDGKSVLNHVKDDSLSALGVTAKQGTQAYKDFDVQVYYSRLIDLIGGPLEKTGAPEKAGEARRDYTLTAVELPDGWEPTVDSNNVAAGWVSIHRGERETWECAVYRSDGTILELDGYIVYGGEGPRSRGDATRCLVCRGYLWNAYDVEEGRLLLEQPVVDGDENFWDRLDPCFPESDQPRPTRDEATGLYGYKDDAGNWTVPARYLDLWYLGDGMFNYWGHDWQTDCGLVSIDGVETPTETFSSWFNGGLFANYGLIAMSHESGGAWVMSYYDYAGNQVSEDFDWAGPIGDDGAGFVRRDGGLFRIQF